MKPTITNLAAKITGRKCSRCRHNIDGRCCHPDGRMFTRCWQSVTRPGFERRPGKYERQDTQLTPQEQHEFGKIQQALQAAEDEARESGLLTED
jgi:hypothetical protein